MMESITLPIRDKKMMIWNFMEELCRKYQDAINDGRQPSFHLNDFEYINSFERYLSRAGLIASNTDSIILDTLLGYEQRGYYKIENDIVTLTESGLAECRKPVHDWA
jgi:hypothetical protein